MKKNVAYRLARPKSAAKRAKIWHFHISSGDFSIWKAKAARYFY